MAAHARSVSSPRPGIGPCCHHQRRSTGHALEPALRGCGRQAEHRPQDGALDPVALTEALLQATRDRAGQVRRATVTALRLRAGRVVGVETTGGFVAAGRVVVAAGTATSSLCESLGVDLPVEAVPAVRVRLSAPEDMVRAVVDTGQAEVRQSGQHEVLAATAYLGSEDPACRKEMGQRTAAHLASTFTTAKDLRVRNVQVRQRPIPADGVPIVGALPGSRDVFVAVAHPGIQLAPILGRLLADQIADDAPPIELQPCDPQRFATSHHQAP